MATIGDASSVTMQQVIPVAGSISGTSGSSQAISVPFSAPSSSDDQTQFIITADGQTQLVTSTGPTTTHQILQQTETETANEAIDHGASGQLVFTSDDGHTQLVTTSNSTSNSNLTINLNQQEHDHSQVQTQAQTQAQTQTQILTMTAENTDGENGNGEGQLLIISGQNHAQLLTSDDGSQFVTSAEFESYGGQLINSDSAAMVGGNEDGLVDENEAETGTGSGEKAILDQHTS